MSFFIRTSRIDFRRVVLRADVVPEALRPFAGGLEVRVDVVSKDHLFLLRHALAEIDADVRVAAARARELEAHVMIPRERHEVRSVA